MSTVLAIVCIWALSIAALCVVCMPLFVLAKRYDKLSTQASDEELLTLIYPACGVCGEREECDYCKWCRRHEKDPEHLARTEQQHAGKQIIHRLALTTKE